MHVEKNSEQITTSQKIAHFQSLMAKGFLGSGWVNPVLEEIVPALAGVVDCVLKSHQTASSVTGFRVAQLAIIKDYSKLSILYHHLKKDWNGDELSKEREEQFFWIQAKIIEEYSEFREAPNAEAAFGELLQMIDCSILGCGINPEDNETTLQLIRGLSAGGIMLSSVLGFMNYYESGFNASTDEELDVLKHELEKLVKITLHREMHRIQARSISKGALSLERHMFFALLDISLSSMTITSVPNNTVDEVVRTLDIVISSGQHTLRDLDEKNSPSWMFVKETLSRVYPCHHLLQIRDMQLNDLISELFTFTHSVSSEELN